MNRREFFRAASAAAAAAIVARLTPGAKPIGYLFGMPVYETEVVPTDFVVSVDDGLLKRSVSISGMQIVDGELVASVQMDMEKAWSAVTVSDNLGGVWRTTDGEAWAPA